MRPGGAKVYDFERARQEREEARARQEEPCECPACTFGRHGIAASETLSDARLASDPHGHVLLTAERLLGSAPPEGPGLPVPITWLPAVHVLACDTCGLPGRDFRMGHATCGCRVLWCTQCESGGMPRGWACQLHREAGF